MRFRDVKQFTQDGNYRVDISWDYVEDWLAGHGDIGIELDPDFQRAHVWTEDQQRAFVEFSIKGGKGSNELRFNCSGWMHARQDGPMVLVDGKQRLEAVRKFLRGDLQILGGYTFSDFDDKLDMLVARFSVRVNDLATRAEVLQWYLDINGGGVVHTDEELDKVRRMLENDG